ncbi:LytR C-terminal domain-containing protein [uncultured Massilia sp.]|uniref:LytR C-terminal domain-containing protein n=1 Tax=uncultured Massilia sp. TaxID=169973 RepID=UPI00258F61CF|nr:LytR C-terminal domain-containing protein [uncultured Massilia sp.]
MRTPILLTRLALLGLGASLLACAPISGRVERQRATPAADDAYLAGRNHHLARRYEEARADYEAALRIAPGHVNARNGLATLHAEQREFGPAIALWRALTESVNLSSGPAKAYLFSNLGHALFLDGNYDGALVALEKACLLDPLNDRAWRLLGETLRKLGQEERAGQMLAQAEALRAHDLRADYAALGAAPTVAAIDRAAKAEPAGQGGWNQLQLHVGVDGMLELRRDQVAATAAALPQPSPQPAPARGTQDTPLVLLEIRNGNGMRGMARKLAGQLGDDGMKVARISNQKGFGVRRTRVEYEPAWRSQAERLAERFGGAELQEVARCAPANLRVVLGRDLARRGFALRPAGPAPAPEVSGPRIAANKAS